MTSPSVSPPQAPQISPPTPTESETWIEVVVGSKAFGPNSYRFSGLATRLAEEINQRINKHQLNTEPIKIKRRDMNEMKFATAPFACIVIDLEKPPTLDPSDKQIFSNYLLRGGFLWVLAHAPNHSYDYRPSLNGESLANAILKRMLSPSSLPPGSVTPAGFTPIVPPSLIDPTMGGELTQLITDRLKNLDVLWIDGRPAAVVNPIWPNARNEDITRIKTPEGTRATFNVRHLAVNLYVNILLH